MKTLVIIAIAIIILPCKQDNSASSPDDNTTTQDSVEIKVDQVTFQSTFKGWWHLEWTFER